MDYEKTYKEVLERAKVEQETFFNLGNISAKAAIERIFPELRESEDEKIRKELIAFLKEEEAKADITSKRSKTLCKYIAWLEKQGEKHTIVNESPSKEMILAVWELGNIWKELTKGSSCTEYGTQLQYIQKHWNESGYYEKLQGEHNSSWSEEDKEMILDTIRAFQLAYPYATEEENPRKRNIDWLKSLKPRWKPSKKQLEALRVASEVGTANNSWAMSVLKDLLEELKLLKDYD